MRGGAPASKGSVTCWRESGEGAAHARAPGLKTERLGGGDTPQSENFYSRISVTAASSRFERHQTLFKGLEFHFRNVGLLMDYTLHLLIGVIVWFSEKTKRNEKKKKLGVRVRVRVTWC